ncbi:MAG: SDR family oxidoreductase [Desulfobacterales bacterium]|jgi:NAD(P)-dependent dehydrogenase (short-subunit alcohol dehydrogenase family)|nr:SDR family oxidoreductase [Desulfobacterales bacterium]
MATEKKLIGSRAIVTGAAQGFGESIVRALAHEGASVAIADLNLQGAKQVASEVEASGGSALAIKVDVTQPQEVAKMVEEVLNRWNTIDILVNNAGGWYKSSSIVEFTDDQWDQIITLNLKSVFLCSRAVAKHMMERRKGRIINIASRGGVHPSSTGIANIAYVTAKGGVITFTKHLATELAPYGVTVNSIAPGTALTPRVKKVRDAESLRRIAERNPMGHLIEPQDVAEAALFLASEGSRYITGINLNVNAGLVMI